LVTLVRFLGRETHELFLRQATRYLVEGVGLVFPFFVGVFVCEFGGCGGVDVAGCAGRGLEFDDQDFEDFEGGGDDGVLVGVYEGNVLVYVEDAELAIGKDGKARKTKGKNSGGDRPLPCLASNVSTTNLTLGIRLIGQPFITARKVERGRQST
jgi:hypothetical protein